MLTKPFSSTVIGSFSELGYVESLVSLQGRSSLRVCARVSDFKQLEKRLAAVDALLPSLLSDLKSVEQLVSNRYPGQAYAHVWEVWVNTDGTAAYRCGSDDAAEEEFVVVSRSESGALEVKA